MKSYKEGVLNLISEILIKLFSIIQYNQPKQTENCKEGVSNFVENEGSAVQANLDYPQVVKPSNLNTQASVDAGQSVICDVTINVNNIPYTVMEYATTDRVCQAAYYQNQDYFVKISPVHNKCRGGGSNATKFYQEYYNAEKHLAPKLVAYETKDGELYEVYERLHGIGIKGYIIENSLDNVSARALIKSILDTLVVFEKDGIIHGDVQLRNLMLVQDKVYLIDFDRFGANPMVMHKVSNFIYDLKNAPIEKYIKENLYSKIKSQDIKDYHECCIDIAAAVLNGEVSSVQEIIEKFY